MSPFVFLESIKKMPIMSLPVRSTFVPVQNGGVLISPGSALSEDQFRSLNLVTDLVAPNLLHCAGMMKASSIFPKARKWGVPKAQKVKPDIAWTDELSEAQWPYQSELAMVQLQGLPAIREVVFFHASSKSLIVTDLCFNMLAVRGLGPWLILSLFGTYRRLAVSKLFLRYVYDKEAFEKSLEKVFSYDFENVILSHGENIIGDAKAKLLSALNQRQINPIIQSLKKEGMA